MPLLLLTGLPASGKTTVASLIREFMAGKGVSNIHVVCDEGLGSFNRGVYGNSLKEKDVRAYLRSETQRLLAPDALVIVDSLNYIKGYRYELFCIAKGAKTSYAVVQCIVNGETAREFNRRKPISSERYDESILTELVMRYEMPEGRNRWDSPLLTYNPNMSKTEEETQLLGDLYTALYSPSQKLSPNLSTRNVPLASASFLQDIDKVSQEVIQLLYVAQQTATQGDKIPVPHCKDPVEFREKRSMAEFARLKRQFIAYVKTRPRLAEDYKADQNILYSQFVHFVNHNVL